MPTEIKETMCQQEEVEELRARVAAWEPVILAVLVADARGMLPESAISSATRAIPVEYRPTRKAERDP
jgi:hypothetical protein